MAINMKSYLDRLVSRSFNKLSGAPHYALKTTGVLSTAHTALASAVEGGAPPSTPDLPPPGIPPWTFLMRPGKSMIVNLNDLPNPHPRAGPIGSYTSAFANWGGGCNVPWLSAYGGKTFTGGGHRGGNDPIVTLFDHTTGLYSFAGTPWTTDYGLHVPPVGNPDRVYFYITTNSVESNQYFDPYWQDLDTGDGPVCAAHHGYYYHIPLSPEQAGNIRGAMLMVWLVHEFHPVPKLHRVAPHILNLDTMRFERWGDKPLVGGQGNLYWAGGPYMGAWNDTRRDMVYVQGVNSSSHARLELVKRKNYTVTNSFRGAPSNYFKPIYVEERDITVVIGSDSALNLKIFAYDHSSGTPVYKPLVAAAPPTVLTGGVGSDWCPHTGKFYIYEGHGSKRVIALIPPEDWLNGEWRWKIQTIDGPAPALPLKPGEKPGTHTAPFSRWAYNAALRVFDYCPGPVDALCYDGVERTGPLMVWRPEDLSVIDPL